MKLRRAASIRCAGLIAPLAILLALFNGCGHPKQTPVNVPPPPSPSSEAPAGDSAKIKNPPEPERKDDASSELAEPTIPAGAVPLATETGKASWYGPPYHNRRGSNGEVYNMHAMTAAHRTLPLGSVVRVTNLKNGRTALVRITDRGPFIPGRVIDLSLAAARKLDVYTPGVADGKVEVMQAPVPLETGGKWAVQIGGFPDEEEARKMTDHLERRYRTAKVKCLKSPAGDWWVRVRVLEDDRQRAQQLAGETTTTEGEVFLVRLD